MDSVYGRPRRASDEQVAAIMAWFNARRKTKAQLASELGLTIRVIDYTIALRGQYKTPPPERRGAALEAQRSRHKRLKRDGWL